jgi:hypothetical protein
MDALHRMDTLFASLVFANIIAMYFAGLTITERLHKRAYARRLASLPAVHLRPASDKREGGAAAAVSRGAKGCKVPPDFAQQRLIFRSRAKVLSQRIASQDTLVGLHAVPAALFAAPDSFAREFNEAA